MVSQKTFKKKNQPPGATVPCSPPPPPHNLCIVCLIIDCKAAGVKFYLPTNFVDVRVPGARSYLQDAGDGLPAVGQALCDVLQRQLVVEQRDGAPLTPQRHVVVGSVVRLRRTTPEQLGRPVVEHRAVVQSVAAQIARFFDCFERQRENGFFKASGASARSWKSFADYMIIYIICVQWKSLITTSRAT